MTLTPARPGPGFPESLHPLGRNVHLGYLRITRRASGSQRFLSVYSTCAKHLLTIHGDNLGILRGSRLTSTQGFQALVQCQAEGTALPKKGLTKLDEATREPKSPCKFSFYKPTSLLEMYGIWSCESHHSFGVVHAENNSKRSLQIRLIPGA